MSGLERAGHESNSSHRSNGLAGGQDRWEGAITEGSSEERYIGRTWKGTVIQVAGSGIINGKGSESDTQVGDLLGLHGEVVVSLRLPASVSVSLSFALLVCFYRSVLIVGPTKVCDSFVHFPSSLTHVTCINSAEYAIFVVIRDRPWYL
jgi:hypothetical protein